ncbi:MAG: hypothetical protein IJW47_02290, partial [Clostridia bacterium]|nr:hypothetical protein [Clostridia bacterium]
MARDMIKGISFLNPVNVDGEYYDFIVDYGIKNGYDHLQLIGPTHDGVRGNADGMIYLKKYSQFNGTKDAKYVDYCLNVVNRATKKAHEHGIKNYFWHHELDLPDGFKETFPQTLNSDGDIEVTHPIVKDYLENRVIDFFDAYPFMDGLILTLHETKVPLLKLKNQKLSKVERVKYVTEILYNSCKNIGKDLIVRPFASLEEDYVMMTKAYEQISNEMFIMDKWTQFDWSLTAPHNRFYNKIKNNPLFVETDIFGEFFGKGRLPLMLKEHIKEKFKYCEQFNPAGYVSRIDRNGNRPFGQVNEVNLNIMNAVMKGTDVDLEIDKFFAEKYGEYGYKVKEIMEKTEDVLKKIIYLKGYYYSELSLFPSLNHSKNHFYFEMMKENYCIASNEWFIPIGWVRGDMAGVLEEKRSAMEDAQILFDKLTELDGKLKKEEYDKLYVQFANLNFVAKCWVELTDAYISYIKFFETDDSSYQNKLYKALENLLELNRQGLELLGKNFYCVVDDGAFGTFGYNELIKNFITEVKQSFELEKAVNEKLKAENLTDYVVCGGANESHKLQKEVNFSDTLILPDGLCRIPGNRKGMKWSTINAHGWFSYQLKVNKNTENTIKIIASSNTESIDMKVSIDDVEYVIKEKADGKKEFTFTLNTGDTDAVRIRIDRISGNTPCVYQIKV